MAVTSMGRTGTLTLQVAEEIRAMMGRRRVTGARLARELHVSQAWVSDRLRGITPMTLTDLERIAAVLGVAVIELLPRTALTVNPANAGNIMPGPGQPEASVRNVPAPEQSVRTGYPERASARRPRDNRPPSRQKFPVLPPAYRRPVPRRRAA